MPIKALLIDADGVIQHAARDWIEAFKTLFDFPDHETARKFTNDIYAAESPTLTTTGGFCESLAMTLKNWRLDDRIDQALDVMNAITPHSENLRIFNSIRSQGILCCLASNQQSNRAKVMSEGLGYRSLFDHEFYSCRLGAAKPDQKFFTAALTLVGHDPGSTLFIDDRINNVEGAKSVGLNAEVYDLKTGSDTLIKLLGQYNLTAR